MFLFLQMCLMSAFTTKYMLLCQLNTINTFSQFCISDLNMYFGFSYCFAYHVHLYDFYIYIINGNFILKITIYKIV